MLDVVYNNVFYQGMWQCPLSKVTNVPNPMGLSGEAIFVRAILKKVEKILAKAILEDLFGGKTMQLTKSIR